MFDDFTEVLFSTQQNNVPRAYAAAQREKRPITRGQTRPGGGQHPSHPSPAESSGARRLCAGYWPSWPRCPRPSWPRPRTPFLSAWPALRRPLPPNLRFPLPFGGICTHASAAIRPLAQLSSTQGQRRMGAQGDVCVCAAWTHGCCWAQRCQPSEPTMRAV